MGKKLFDQTLLNMKKLNRLPSGWDIGEEELLTDDKAKRFHEVNLDDPGLKQKFQDIVDSTRKAIVTRDRKDGPIAKGFQVTRVVKVENLSTWEKYLTKRDQVKSRLGKDQAPLPASQWAQYSGEVFTKKLGKEILSMCKYPQLEDDVNEFLMFHGTKADVAKSITENHFDMNFASKDGLFGAGLYFAESSTKSDEYVKGNSSGEFPIILARVTLGNIKYCDAADPTKDPGREALERSCGGTGIHHSVLGDRIKVRKTFREFVVYSAEQVYPHFVVWYT